MKVLQVDDAKLANVDCCHGDEETKFSNLSSALSGAEHCFLQHQLPRELTHADLYYDSVEYGN